MTEPRPSTGITDVSPDADPVMCTACDGRGNSPRLIINAWNSVDCVQCDGRGWLGVDVEEPTPFVRGSWQKQAVLQSRYASGVPMHHEEDGYGGYADTYQYRDETDYED